MSSNDGMDERELITRREAVLRVSAILGGAALIGGSALITGCRDESARTLHSPKMRSLFWMK